MPTYCLSLPAACFVHPRHAWVLALQSMLAVPVSLPMAGQDDEGGVGAEAGERFRSALSAGGGGEVRGTALRIVRSERTLIGMIR